MLETVGLVAAIEAADAMLKAADVALVRQQRVVPGLVTHFVVGETAAVRAAVDAGLAAAERVGRVAGSHVIPRPSDDVWRRLVGVALDGDAPAAKADAPKAKKASPTKPAAATEPADASVPATAPPERDYAAMTVRTLRAAARDREDLGLHGRALASASKDDLVDALRRADAAASAGGS
jgi:microcompartment protein CcmL/EutN